MVISRAAHPFLTKVWLVPAVSGTFYGQKMTAGGTYGIAGSGKSGFSGDGGPASKAELNGPGGAAVDKHGNVVITDTGNNRVRVVAAAKGTFYGVKMTAGDDSGSVVTLEGHNRSTIFTPGCSRWPSR